MGDAIEFEVALDITLFVDGCCRLNEFEFAFPCGNGGNCGKGPPIRLFDCVCGEVLFGGIAMTAFGALDGINAYRCCCCDCDVICFGLPLLFPFRMPTRCKLFDTGRPCACCFLIPVIDRELVVGTADITMVELP